MPDSAAEKPAPLPSEQVADEAVFAADQTRKTSAWLASALGAIPSLAIIGSLVRDPGDYGFDTTELALGIGLAAAGAVLGTLAFAWVISPLKLTNDDLANFDMTRLPGPHFDNAQELLVEIELFKDLARADREEGAGVRREAARAKALAAEAERLALLAEAAAKATSGDAGLQATAAEARQRADVAKQEMEQAAADAAAQAVTTPRWEGELEARERFRADALRLRAADEVGDRFFVAKLGAIVSVALVAAGIYFLALAPIEKTPDASAPTVTLVSWSPSKQGAILLGCPTKTIRALQVGGDEKAPQLVTFPTADCPEPKLISFPKQTDTPLGPVTKLKAVEAATNG
jgi:hypothetical protein